MADDFHKFPKLPKDFQNAAQLVQEQLKDEITALDKEIAALADEQKRRRTIAIVLKVVAVLSGIVIALGFTSGAVTQVLGGIVSGLAALERVFANLSRLLAVTSAKAAYERIRRSVVSQHNRDIVFVVKERDREPEKSADLLIFLCGRLRDAIAEVVNRVKNMLAKNDYENIGRLNLDEEDPESPVADTGEVPSDEPNEGEQVADDQLPARAESKGE